jgi:acyl-coenzyme A thioesterase PaaI-like protein
MSTEMAVLFLEATTQSRDADGRPNQFDTTAMSGLRDVKATSGHVIALLDVTQEVSNRYGTLHGGCIGEHESLRHREKDRDPAHHVMAGGVLQACLLSCPAASPACDLRLAGWLTLALGCFVLPAIAIRRALTIMVMLHSFHPPAATLVDTVGSAALISLSPKGGVSLNINVNYLSKVATGGTVRIEAQVR